MPISEFRYRCSKVSCVPCNDELSINTSRVPAEDMVDMDQSRQIHLTQWTWMCSHYSLLHLAGYDSRLQDLKQYQQPGSRTPGNAVGMAIAQKHLAAVFNRQSIICLLWRWKGFLLKLALLLDTLDWVLLFFSFVIIESLLMLQHLWHALRRLSKIPSLWMTYSES